MSDRRRQKRPAQTPLIHTLECPCSYVYTSSRYDEEGNIANPHIRQDRPSLTQNQLRGHAVDATSSASLGLVLPGFIPIRRNRSGSTVSFTPFLFTPNIMARQNSSASSNVSPSTDDSSKDFFASRRTSSDSSPGVLSDEKPSQNSTPRTPLTVVMEGHGHEIGMKNPKILYNARGQRRAPFMAPAGAVSILWFDSIFYKCTHHQVAGLRFSKLRVQRSLTGIAYSSIIYTQHPVIPLVHQRILDTLHFWLLDLLDSLTI